MEINQKFFIRNRRLLSEKLGGSPIVLPAYRALQRSNDMPFLFNQESNFWYLTGVEEPEWWLIIDGTTGESWLMAPDVTESHIVFDGKLSKSDAIKLSGVDGVLSRKEAIKLLDKLSKSSKTVCTIGEHPHQDYFNFVVNPAQQEMWSMLEGIFDNVQDCRPQLAKMRAIKQPVEIEAIRKAIKLTTDAFKTVKLQLPSLKYEYEVEAEFNYYFRKNGATGHAYDPIVAAGKNACTLHYMENNDELKQDGLILIDIGARAYGYAADITRTYALGTPSERAKKVHLATEKAHQSIVKLLKPGLLITEYQSKVDEIMKSTLISLELMSSAKDDKNYRRYFPHAISHGLGIDVHDSLGSPKEFLPGMVITVEPGVYIPEEGVGVRIEDNILITETGYDNLSRSLVTGL